MSRGHRLALLAVSLLLLVAARVPSARASSTPFTVRWIAPGDDSLTGRATAYDLRYSSTPITASNFQFAPRVAGTPPPAVAGTLESFVVSGLSDGAAFYLALKTGDEAGNWSKISNVVSRASTTTGVDSPELAVSFSSPWPNPARSSVHWAYSLPRAAHVDVEVFDVRGRHVYTLARGEQGAGRGEWSWDLRNDRGETVAPGLYLVKARLGAEERTGRMIVVR